MPATVTPLRYPGGKSQLFPFMKNLLKDNVNKKTIYIEPFSGGAGLALKLLFENVVPDIILNDLDPGIYSFWYNCLHYPDELINKIKTTPITINEWEAQRAIYFSQTDKYSLDLGFSTLFLNRTNVSGIISGGVIGGKNQTGSAKIDARFNRNTLVKKIEKIYSYRNHITLYNYDASDLIQAEDLSNNLFFNIDPPYVEKGSQLYRNAYKVEDHKNLAGIIAASPHQWIVTYDICDLVSSLYSQFRGSKIDVNYSANFKRNANEYIFFSNNIKIPDDIVLFGV